MFLVIVILLAQNQGVVFLVASCHGKEFQYECLCWQARRVPEGQHLALLRKGPSSWQVTRFSPGTGGGRSS